MPRGVKRTEVEIIQAEIAAAEKKREQGLQAAANAKKAITQLQNKIDQQYAKEIAKACRMAGIPLKDVLAWVQARQKENASAEKAMPADVTAKKAAPAPARGRKLKTAAKPQKTRKPRKPAAKQSVEDAAEITVPESPAAES